MQVVRMKVSYFDTKGGNPYVKFAAGECYPQTAETLTRVAAGTAELEDAPAADQAQAEDPPAAAPVAPKTKTKPA